MKPEREPDLEEFKFLSSQRVEVQTNTFGRYQRGKRKFEYACCKRHHLDKVEMESLEV